MKESNTTTSDKNPPGSFGRTARKFLILLAITVVAGFALWTWAALAYVYSSGERAGYVQKLSYKGWIFKTWEGDLAMVNLPGTAPEIFHFTVREDEVARRIEQVMGRRVAVAYEEHLGVPMSMFGETSHFVTDVRLTEVESEKGQR